MHSASTCVLTTTATLWGVPEPCMCACAPVRLWDRRCCRMRGASLGDRRRNSGYGCRRSHAAKGVPSQRWVIVSEATSWAATGECKGEGSGAAPCPGFLLRFPSACLRPYSSAASSLAEDSHVSLSSALSSEREGHRLRSVTHRLDTPKSCRMVERRDRSTLSGGHVLD